MMIPYLVTLESVLLKSKTLLSCYPFFSLLILASPPSPIVTVHTD